MSTPAPAPATAADLLDVLGLVRAVGLPTEGIADAFPRGFAVVRDGARLLGTAGLETYGELGLLRSVAVAADQRGLGLGRALVTDRLLAAKEQRLTYVYLLTTTATDYFCALGFVIIDRAAAPVSVKQSLEFTAICPASATCLSIAL